MDRKKLFAIVFALAVALNASNALAQKPVKSEWPYTPSGTIAAGTLCNFDINYDLKMNVAETDFFDLQGNLTRMDCHIVTQDTYSANGKSLVSMPFAYNIRWLFDNDGNLIHLYADGIVEKIWLPDGSLFISAGRLDFVAHGLPDIILSPDHGNPGNIARFCAALAP